MVGAKHRRTRMCLEADGADKAAPARRDPAAVPGGGQVLGLVRLRMLTVHLDPIPSPRRPACMFISAVDFLSAVSFGGDACPVPACSRRWTDT